MMKPVKTKRIPKIFLVYLKSLFRANEIYINHELLVSLLNQALEKSDCQIIKTPEADQMPKVGPRE